ncbi:MAG TPA: TolC family protein [Terriglobales bacterium]|nr:TolC family protein [Terriglobales bacterium]
MLFSRRKFALPLLAIAIGVMLASASWAQDSTQSAASAAPSQATPIQAPQPQNYQSVDYSKPRGYFPSPLRPYAPQHVPPPSLSNTPRIDQLMHEGKIMLSIDDAVALALENNLDMGIARYTLNIADTDVLRAKSGASILGVPFGVVQNTPGGGVGGLGATVGSGTGGTSVAAGGIGAGTAGIVTSTLGIGVPITSFDPIFTGNLQWDHANAIATSLFTGVPVLSQNTQTYNFGFNQELQSGTNVFVGFNNTRITTNGPFTNYSPLINSLFQFRLTQHLIQGFGFLPNTRFIRIAKNNREISDIAFRLQTITTVDQIENMYWDLVFAYENVRVQRESLAFAQKTLSDTQKQVQIGSLAPIEVVRAQSTVAADQQSLITAENNLQLQQLLMKNALSRNLHDPVLADADVIPTSTMKLPEQEPVIPTEDLVNDALSHRPELAESRIDLQNREINNKAVRNAQLPTLDAFAYYGGSGLGGAQNPANLCVNQRADIRALGFCSGPNPSAPPGSETIPPSSTLSYGSALNDLVSSTAPDKGLGLTLNIPIRNRNAQANQVRAELEYRQAQMRLQQIENQIRIEVRNAQFSVTQNRAAVNAARAAVELGRQSLEAEQKKLNLGASTSTLVLQNESALATAESTLVSAMASYEKSRLELDRATGLLLDHAGIIMADAERGEVTHMPNVPYVAPRTNPESVMPPSQTLQPSPQSQ